VARAPAGGGLPGMTSDMEPMQDILQRAGVVRRERIADGERPPVCPNCLGAGYLRFDVPVDDPRFGELIVCECTRAELETKRQAMLLARSQLADLQAFTFEKWAIKVKEGRPPPNHPDFAYRAARQFAADPHYAGMPWLLLQGTKGTGKTHLAAAIGNERLHLGQPAIFMVVPDLLDHLRATFSPSSDTTYDDLFESLRNTQLLILDDLGTQTASSWAREKLYQLINHRYNRRIPTVVTMNTETEEIDSRLLSRINDIQFVQRVTVIASDYRTSEPPPNQKAPQYRAKTRVTDKL
jgi:DNA replication protein DnaC